MRDQIGSLSAGGPPLDTIPGDITLIAKTPQRDDLDSSRSHIPAIASSRLSGAAAYSSGSMV